MLENQPPRRAAQRLNEGMCLGPVHGSRVPIRCQEPVQAREPRDGAHGERFEDPSVTSPDEPKAENLRRMECSTWMPFGMRVMM